MKPIIKDWSRYHLKDEEGKYFFDYVENKKTVKFLKIDFEKLTKDNFSFTSLFEKILTIGVCEVNLYKTRTSFLKLQNFIYKGTFEEVFSLFLGFCILWSLNPKKLHNFIKKQEQENIYSGNPIDLLNKLQK